MNMLGGGRGGFVDMMPRSFDGSHVNDIVSCLFVYLAVLNLTMLSVVLPVYLAVLNLTML
jgi:hypothetical protein